jgi:hypothetical protein
MKIILICRIYGAIKLIVPLIVTWLVAIKIGRAIFTVGGKYKTH